MTTIAYLGPEHSYTHLAARSAYGEDTCYKPMAADSICRSVRKGQTDIGVLPVENNTFGFVNKTLHSLYWTAEVFVEHEVVRPIQHQLITQAAELDQIRAIASHPQAIGQCSRMIQTLRELSGNNLAIKEVASTSLGVVMASKDPHLAAIGAREAAENYEVPILAENIQDSPENATRFWALRLGEPRRPQGHCSTVFLLEMKEGGKGLTRVLSLFNRYDIDVNWINTQCIPSKSRVNSWQRAWFVSCSGHIWDESLKAAYKVLRRQPDLFNRVPRVIGSFPSKVDALPMNTDSRRTCHAS